MSIKIVLLFIFILLVVALILKSTAFKTLYCICGETCSGKDTMVKQITQEHPLLFRAVVSYTTRPKRESETEGIEHYFVDKEKFDYLKKKNKVLAYTKICSEDNPDGYEYMALKKELRKANLYVIDPLGIEDLKKRFPYLRIKVIYIYSSLEQRENRAKISRSDFVDKFYKRIEQEKAQFEEFATQKKYDYIVHNIDHSQELAYSNFKKILFNKVNKFN